MFLLQVAMGGGRTNFYPNTTTEPEYNEEGRRQDGLNLTSLVEQELHTLPEHLSSSREGLVLLDL
jgi:alkaline phosphatase